MVCLDNLSLVGLSALRPFRSAGICPAGPIAFCTSCPWWLSPLLPAFPDALQKLLELTVTTWMLLLPSCCPGAPAGGDLKMALRGCLAHCSDAYTGGGLLGTPPAVAAGRTQRNGSSGFWGAARSGVASEMPSGVPAPLTVPLTLLVTTLTLGW